MLPLFDWFFALPRGEKRTFWACLGGWALDAMDTQIYALAMPTLIALWALTNVQAGTLATAVLIVASLGGWLAGYFADRFGRVRMLQITILWFAVFTFLSGLTDSYWQLLVTRSLQGLGFGGEWAVGAVLISEVVAPPYRGRAAGSMHSGWALGYGAAVILSTLLFALLPAEIAWRALFFIGILPALAVFFIRRFIEEPQIFLDAHKAQTPGRRAPWEIFSRLHRRRTAIAVMLAAGVYGGNYVLITWLPTYLKTVLDLSVTATGGYLAINILGSFVGAFVNAYLSDWAGRRMTFVVCALCQAATVAVYTMAPIGFTTTLLLGFVLGTMQSGTAAGMAAWFAELFPTHIRATAQGFAANAGRAAGALSPTLVGVIALSLPLGPAMGICALVAYAVVILATCLMPETRGVDLREIDDDDVPR